MNQQTDDKEAAKIDDTVSQSELSEPLGTSADPEPTNIWLNTVSCRLEIRLDFDNDRHHAVMVDGPYNTERLAQALITLAHNIMRDPYLRRT